MFPFGEWVYKKLGYKKIATMMLDFQFGYDSTGGFQKTFEEAGGQIIQKLLVPVNTLDFGPYIARVRKDADALMTGFGGVMNLKFPKQYQESGLKLPMICSGTNVDESVFPPRAMKCSDISLPCITARLLISPPTGVPAEYQTRYNKIGSYYATHSYEFGMWLVRAIEMVKGDVESKEDFLKAIKNVKLTDTPRGPFHMDEYGNPVQNVYIRKVEKVKDHPLDFLKSGEIKWNVVIDRSPMFRSSGNTTPRNT